MRHTAQRAGLAMILTATLLISACSVREELFLEADGSGTGRIDIRLHPILLSYYSDLLSAMTGVPGDYPVFDLEQLEQSFAEQPSVELVLLERPARGRLEMEVRFADLSGVAADVETGGGASFDSMFEFERIGAERRMTVRLDRSAVNSFLSFAPPESATMMGFLLPPDDGSVTRDEYQGELAWALEEYADPSEVADVLDSATIEVVVRPAGRIQSQTGGRIVGDTVVFSVPILDLLTLTNERVYELVFRP